MVATRDARTPGAPPPPAALRPFLQFTRLPDRALLSVRRVLDDDASFRAHVLESVDSAALERPAELFLRRPDGWEEELAVITEEAIDRARSDDEARREAEAVRRAEQLDSTVTELRAELAALQAELDATSSRLHREEAARHSVERELAATRDERDSAGIDRAEAVRQLKAAEALAQRRLARVRELESADPGAVEPAGDTEPVATLGEVGRAVVEATDAAASAAAALSASLAEVATLLRRLVPAESTPATSPPVDREAAPVALAAGAEAQPSVRRVPVRIGRGLTADSVDGVAQLLGTPAMVVLVDGYNASMSAWPDQPIGLQRDRLVQALGQVRGRTGAEVHVVFDGAHDGKRPAVAAPLPVRVHFTEAGVEADDRLLQMVSSIDPERPVAVVSGDHRVRDGAVELGANVVEPVVLLQLARR